MFVKFPSLYGLLIPGSSSEIKLSNKYTGFDWFCSAFLYGVPVIVSTIVALFVPGDILTFDWARLWVEFVLGIAPKMLNVPVESQDPQVVKFYHATMLAFVAFWLPPSIGLMVFKLNKERWRNCFLLPRSRRETVKILLASLLMIGVGWSAFSIGYHGGRGAALWCSRFHLVVTGVCFHLILLMSITAFVVQTIEVVVFSKIGSRLFRRK